DQGKAVAPRHRPEQRHPRRAFGVGSRPPARSADNLVALPLHLEGYGVGPAVIGDGQEEGARPTGRHLLPHLVEFDADAHALVSFTTDRPPPPSTLSTSPVM